MIEPAGNLTVLDHRPPIRAPIWQRCIAQVASPFIRQRIQKNRPDQLTRLREVLALARECQSREAVEALMGKPKYALNGSLYSKVPMASGDFAQPDVVEVYELDDCGIELMFSDGSFIGMLGMPMPSTWEIAVGALPEND